MKFLHLTTPIFEAPINDLDLIGSFEKKDDSPFNISDQKLLKSSKHIQKIRNVFNHSKFNFNMYMINHPEAKKFDHRVFGSVKLKWIYSNLPEVSKELELLSKNKNRIGYANSPFQQNVINILFFGNKGDNLVPMTPWIIAHRTAHALQTNITSRRIKKGNSFRERPINLELRKFFMEMTTFIWKGYEGHEKIDIHQNNHAFFNCVSLWYNIGKFKSARNKNISRWTEIPFELVAQYILTGKIEFNELPKNIEMGSEIVTMPDSKYNFYNNYLKKSTKTYENFINILLRDSIGKIWVI